MYRPKSPASQTRDIQKIHLGATRHHGRFQDELLALTDELTRWRLPLDEGRSPAPKEG